MRSTSIVVATLFASTSGCISASQPKTPREGGPPWQEITTEHFIIDTDLDPQLAAETAQQLENLRNAMIEVVFGRQPPPSPKLRVLALRSDEYGYYGTQSTGVFMSNVLHQPVLATSPGGEWGSMQNNIRVHEIAHYVSSLYMNIERQPRWFAEGFGRYLETLRYDEKGKVEVGRPPLNYEYLQFVKQSYFDELWAWDDDSHLSEGKVSELYETSWAVVHWLFDERHDDAVRFQDAIAAGKDPKKAWQEIFPDIDDHGMNEIVGKYVNKHGEKITKGQVAPLHVTIQSRPLADEDVLGFRSMLYMAFRGMTSRSQEESKKLALSNVDAALHINNAAFWANEVNYVYFGKLPATTDLAKRGAESQTDNWLAWVYYADVIGALNGPAEERRAAAKHAIDLAPQSSLALASASRAEGQAGDWKTALELAERAMRTRSISLNAVTAYAGALAHSSRCDDARKVVGELRARHKRDLPKEIASEVEEVEGFCSSH
jgi:hypothetical protein